VRVVAPDFDLSVAPDYIIMDSRPLNIGFGYLERVASRVGWHLARLAGRE
jgi:hypothetical protein